MSFEEISLSGLICFSGQEGFHQQVLTDSSSENRGCDCLAGLECLLNIIRALRMGSCFSAESRSPIPGSPSSPGLGIRKRKSSRKKLGSRNPSFDYRREEPLHRIPGRLFLNGSSEIASLFTQQGKKGTNQDAMIVWEVSSFSCSCVIVQFWTWFLSCSNIRFTFEYIYIYILWKASCPFVYLLLLS